MKNLITFLFLAIAPLFYFSQNDCPYEFFDEDGHAFMSIPLTDSLDFITCDSPFSLELTAHSARSVVMMSIYGYYLEYPTDGLKIVFPVKAFRKKVAKKNFVHSRFEQDDIHYAFVLRLADEILLIEQDGCFGEGIMP